MRPPSVRAVLVGLVAALALLAVFGAPLPTWAALPVLAVVVLTTIRALRNAPGRHRLELIEGGRVRIRTPAGDRLHGSLQAAYSSGFYCAFTVHDPARGSRRFGLFRDELDADGWRRLRVALRTGGSP